MSTDDLPQTRLEEDDELLSAYLDGELHEEAAAAFEARLASEPALARRLDDVADTLVALRRLDAVAPPEGFASRLAARIDELDEPDEVEEPDGLGEPAAPAPSPAGVPVDDLASRRTARRQRLRSTPSWAAWGGVAAVFVALAVLFAGGLGFDRPTSDQGAEIALDAGAGDSAGSAAVAEAPAAADGERAEALQAPAAEPFDADPGQEQGFAPADDATTSAAPATLPVVVASGLEVDDTADLEAAYANLPEASSVIGTPRAEAERLAAGALSALRDLAAFPDAPPASGLAPDACLDTLRTATEAPLVLVRAEALEFQDEPALAYVVVLAGPGSPALDQVQAWVLAPVTCTPVAQTPVPMVASEG